MFIDQHDHGKLRQRSLGGCAENLLGPIPALYTDDHAIFDKHINHLLRLIQLSAGVEAQVQNKSLQSLPEKDIHHALELFVGIAGELRDPDVADLRLLAGPIVPGIVLAAAQSLDGWNDDFL